MDEGTKRALQRLWVYVLKRDDEHRKAALNGRMNLIILCVCARDAELLQSFRSLTKRIGPYCCRGHILK